MTDHQRNTSLRELFDEIVALIRDTAVTDDLRISDSNKLQMYGLYKQATIGPCDEAEAPSRLHLVARAKYQAWLECRGRTMEEAMLAYVELASSHNHWLGIKCREKLLEWKASSVSSSEGADSTESKLSLACSDADEEREPTSVPINDAADDINHETTLHVQPKRTKFYSLLDKYFGIRPLIPRGQLDISYRDLAFAAWQCFRLSSSMTQYCQLEQQVSQLWLSQRPSESDVSVVPGLSVRSLLDLYLRAASFPAGSEIIMNPPINIPAIIDVLLHHNISVVAVDIPKQEGGRGIVSVNVKAIEEAITDKTVAIMIVHPFGMISATDKDMKSLRYLAGKHELHLLEDCAECFIGLGPDCYRGSPEAHVCFFSFGTIKTATALGGGIAILRNVTIAETMNRMHYSLYKQQTAANYLGKVLWCMLVQVIADCPLLYGMLFAIFSSVGLDLDMIVYLSTRSFAPWKRGTDRGTSDTKCGMIYVHQLRKRPSTALFSVLARRLEQAQSISPSFKLRMEQCTYTATMLKQSAPKNVEQPTAVSDAANTYWIYPILVNSPGAVSQALRKQGFDVTRGSSQLQSIAKYTLNPTSCERTDDLMNRILYLPVASKEMSKVDLRRLVFALDDVTSSVPERSCATKYMQNCEICSSLRSTARNHATKRMINILFVMLFVCLDAWLFQCIPLSRIILGLGMTALRLIFTALTVALVAAISMRWIMADFYLQSSQCFAKYSSMLFKKPYSKSDKDDTSGSNTSTHEDSEALWSTDALRIPSNDESPNDNVVILTGATGFIGRLLLRDLLLHRKALSIQGGVVVLCRSKRGRSAYARISKLLGDAMYSFLSEAEKEELVFVVEGDVTKPNAGLSTEDLSNICNHLNVTHVIHCAASVSFTQSLKDSAVSNITSSLNLQSLTRCLKRRPAQYIHISTAFVHGGLTGTKKDPLPEQLHSLGVYDAAELYRSMLGTEYLASAAMNELHFPNTYAFSKCICEHLLTQDKTTPTIVIRPSIVGPAIQHPYEGWSGDKPTTIVAAACLYMSYQWNLWCFGNHRVPYIPVDVVSRYVLAKGFAGVAGMSEALSGRRCDSPAASSSDDGFERITLPNDFSVSEVDEILPSAPPVSFGEGFRGKEWHRYEIHNCAWDLGSPDTAMFTWIDYAVTVTHVGAVLGYFSRLTAYIGLFLTVRVLPGMRVKQRTFRTLHRVLVQIPVNTIVTWFKLAVWFPGSIDTLSKLSAFLDLPLLFFHFMNNDFYFVSDLVAPGHLAGDKYLFSCAVAAENFVSSIEARSGKKDLLKSSEVTLGGATHKPLCTDLWWAATQPRGSCVVRIAGWMFRKILRASSVSVTVDAQSFAPALHARSSTSKGQRSHIVLAPNHRSFFDFFLVSYLAFALPELDIEMPFIAAADDFERLPLVGWLAARANAFFLRRGAGKADPTLKATLSRLQADNGMRGICVEVFIEGSRSRDRRYLKPKTGFLRCLAETGGDYIVVPISINYEKVPEQASFAAEVDRGSRSNLSSNGLFTWLRRALFGNVDIGMIHIAAASPLPVDATLPTDFGALAADIQRRQQDLVRVSNYHCHAMSLALGLPMATTEQALIAIGCSNWPGHSCVGCLSCGSAPVSPASKTEQWMVLLHVGHKLSPFFQCSHPRWCKWLDKIGRKESTPPACGKDPSVRMLVEALGKAFHDADQQVDNALESLRQKGFDKPERDHVVQSVLNESDHSPTLLIRASVSFRIDEDSLCPQSSSSDDAPLLVNSQMEDFNDEHETLGFWGFRDSGFVLHLSRNGKTFVTMKGDRYSICGKPLRKLIPFIEKETSTRINPLIEHPFSSRTPVQLPSDLSDENLNLLKSTFTKFSISAADRIRHGSGHSQEDMYLIRSGAIKNIRLPDAVVWPSSEEEVCLLVSMAKSEGWCLIPFGGGTNVSHATRCPTKDIEPRPILSVDMRLMDRILWVNEEDGLAHVQGGITGRVLVKEMSRRGYTTGHEPDSIEFSTLGGWIATKASGMKRNKYGNIEDIVKSVRVAGPDGLLWRGKDDNDVGCCGRESRGLDFLSMALGMEGSFGIITSAVLRVWPLPECREYDSVILPDFQHGLRFAREASRLGSNLPSSVRLLDNEHFRLGQALRGDSSLTEQCLAYLWKAAHPMIQSWSSDSVVCATILFEGTRVEVETQRRAIKTLASEHGGTCVGARIGRSGYELTFAIAYLRDFALTYDFLAESFETFAPWSKVESIIHDTKERIKKEHRLRCLPGEPFIGSRVTQLYHEGACLYFYFCMNIRGVPNPSSVFAEIEHAARQEILDRGGSLSHHHGIGKLRSDFTKEMDSDAYHSFISSLKETVDPSNVFGVRNGTFA